MSGHQHPPLPVSRLMAFFRVRPKCCRDAHRRLNVGAGRTLSRSEFESFEDAWRNRWSDGQCHGMLIQNGLVTAGPPVPAGQIWDVAPGHEVIRLDEIAPAIWEYGTRDVATGRRDVSAKIRIGADNATEAKRLSGN